MIESLLLIIVQAIGMLVTVGLLCASLLTMAFMFVEKEPLSEVLQEFKYLIKIIIVFAICFFALRL